MSTVMEAGEVTTVAMGVPGAPMPSRRTTTLYDLVTTIQDIVGPEDDALVVATVVQLLQSRRCTWRGVTIQVSPFTEVDTDCSGESSWRRQY